MKPTRRVFAFILAVLLSVAVQAADFTFNSGTGNTWGGGTFNEDVTITADDVTVTVIGDVSIDGLLTHTMDSQGSILQFLDGNHYIRDFVNLRHVSTEFLGDSKTTVGNFSVGAQWTGYARVKDNATLDVTGNFMLNWYEGTQGVFEQTGGTVNLTTSGNGIRLGHWPNNAKVDDEPQYPSRYSLSDGVLNVLNTTMYVGWDGPAELNISGGTASIKGLSLAHSGGNSNGKLNLSGGELRIGSDGVSKGNGTARVSLSGGKIVAMDSHSWADNLPVNLTNSVTFDTNGNTIFFQPNITGSGDLIKTGGGVLELSGDSDTNEYAVEGTIRRTGGTSTGTIYVAENSGQTATYELTGGELRGATLFVGNNGNGTFIQTGGKTNTGEVYLGTSLPGDGVGTMTFSGGELNTGRFCVGDWGTGFLTVSGNAKINVDFGRNTLAIGSAPGGRGTMTVSENADIFARNFYVGEYGKGTLFQTGGTISAENAFIGGGADHNHGDAVGEATISAGVFNGGNFRVGDWGTGTLTVNGTGKVNGRISVGASSTGVGTMFVSGGAEITPGNFYVGENGTGTLNVSGGKVNVGYWFAVGEENGSVGTVNISGGEINSTYVIPGNKGKGTIVQTGGSVAGREIIIADQNTSGGSGYTISGEDSRLTAEWCLLVGHRAGGSFTQNGGTVTVLGTDVGNIYSGLYVGHPDSGAGTYDLAGGLLVADKIVIRGDNGSTMDMTGGTLWTKNVTGNLTNSGGVLDLVHGRLADLSADEITRIAGNYFQDTDGTLAVELNFSGGTLSTDFLEITGTADLSGAIHLLLTGDWESYDDWGAKIPILSFNEVFGNELSVSYNGYDDARWSFFTEGNYGYLSASPLGNSGDVPEPGTWAMLLMGIGGLAGMAVWRRKK